MTAILSADPIAFAEGEVLVFTSDTVTAKTVCALCGVSGTARSGVIPRLIVCDTEAGALTSAKEASAKGIPVLFLSNEAPPPSCTTGRFSVLPVPLRFSDFRNAVVQFFTAFSPARSYEQAQSLRTQPIRLENGEAISGDARVSLTQCEEKILAALIEAYPHAAEHTRLEEAFSRHGGNSVRVYVTYLRKKLASLPAYRAILSEKGGGFSLVLNTDESDITDNTNEG